MIHRRYRKTLHYMAWDDEPRNWQPICRRVYLRYLWKPEVVKPEYGFKLARVIARRTR